MLDSAWHAYNGHQKLSHAVHRSAGSSRRRVGEARDLSVDVVSPGSPGRAMDTARSWRRARRARTTDDQRSHQRSATTCRARGDDHGPARRTAARVENSPRRCGHSRADPAPPQGPELPRNKLRTDNPTTQTSSCQRYSGRPSGASSHGWCPYLADLDRDRKPAVRGDSAGESLPVRGPRRRDGARQQARNSSATCNSPHVQGLTNPVPGCPVTWHATSGSV